MGLEFYFGSKGSEEWPSSVKELDSAQDPDEGSDNSAKKRRLDPLSKSVKMDPSQHCSP